MLQWFEKLVDPYPTKDLNKPLPTTFFAFVWQATEGVRPFLFLLILCAAAAACFEALFFSYIGKLVDWLSKSQPDTFIATNQQNLTILISILFANIFFVSIQSIIKHQVLFSNFPMRMRWRFHNLLLQQSLDFFHTDFAGRLSAKVMQTALAVREFWMILGDMLVYVLIYFITISLVLGSISPVLIVPLLLWLALFIGIASYFIPRLGRVSQEQADARAVMTGRVTDAYTNIQTVKLFAHAGRESQYAKESMKEFMVTVYKQMRLAVKYQICIRLLSAFLFISVIGTSVWLWTEGQAALGVIAATTAMVLKLDSLAEFIMWHVTMLFENVGTIQDGMKTLGKPIEIQDKPDATELKVPHGEISFENVSFAYNDKNVIDHFNLTIKPGEKIGIVGRSGAGKSTFLRSLNYLETPDSGSIQIDDFKVDFSQITQEEILTLRRKLSMVFQQFNLFERRTALDNVKEGLVVVKKLSDEEATEIAKEELAKVGLSDREQHYPRHLSGGQKQRVAIARALAMKPDVLLLDEPTSALDPELVGEVERSIANAAKSGQTMVLVSHDMSFVAQVADKVLFLDKGKIIESGTPDEIINHPKEERTKEFFASYKRTYI